MRNAAANGPAGGLEPQLVDIAPAPVLARLEGPDDRVLGVGATRGWRATLVGAVAGFAVLAVVVVVAGIALSQVPIGPLRLIVGALLLVFGLQWFRKGVMRVAARGLAGIGMHPEDEPPEWDGVGFDWTAFVLAFKAVVLEGLEVAFIVVSFGANAGQMGVAVVVGVAG